jgi:GMP reductase
MVSSTKIKSNTPKYTYNDLTIVPAIISDINSRSECNPMYDTVYGDRLPIFTAPMSTIINEENELLFEKYGINTIYPRNVGVNINDKSKRNGKLADLLIAQLTKKTNAWIALSLQEFKDIFVDDKYRIHKFMVNGTYRICIDIANGHMWDIYKQINQAKHTAKNKGYTLVIMAGNIANPQTYKWIAQNSNVDYIRVGIGSGSNCVTSSNTGVHYPMASLINYCAYERANLLESGDFNNLPFIVADGGIRNYSDVVKAIGLGADYVMIGGLFTSLLESAADITGKTFDGHIFNIGPNELCVNGKEINCWNINTEEADKREAINRYILSKESYGMSTKKAQELLGGNANKTSEGCYKTVAVKYTLKQWTDNLVSYLKSAMSYTGSRDLNEFKTNAQFVVNTPNAINAVNK